MDHYVGGESAAAYSNNPSQASPENNYGTNATYFRRSRSVQTPVTALKKLWRDAKKEISYRQSVNSRQPEIVAPSPLISVHGGTGYDDGTGGTEASLGRSNTLADIQTPAYNPSYTGHQLLQHSDEQLSAHIPLQPQPWLAPSTAPPRDPSWE
ncbi:hypothetical protein BGZ54_002638 [Gamsiella multidivaricata]|nr:hypothetical protein BGZ54_002638 [Gamsiella multidivaricata]